MSDTNIHILGYSKTSENHFQQVPFLVTRNANCTLPRYPQTHGWSDEEIHKMAIFIVQFQNQLKQKNKNLIASLLHSLSQFIFTRNFNQCRIYYQSILKKGIDTYLEQIRIKFPEIQKDRMQYRILMDCIRSNCILRQNSFNIDFKVQTDDKSVKNNFFDLLSSSFDQRNSIIPEPSEDQGYSLENSSEKRCIQKLHITAKRKSLSMQKLLAQDDTQQRSYHIAEHRSNIYRNNQNIYQFPERQLINFDFQLIRQQLFGFK